MKAIRCLVLMVLVLCAESTFAASFDCGKAESTVEKLICGNANVSRLDTQLQDTYQKALSAIDPSSKAKLIGEQRHWIKYTRNLCQDEACLKDAYAARIDVLGRNVKYIVNKASCDIPDGNSCRSVVLCRDSSSRIDSFNQSLIKQKMAGQIVGCTSLIALPIGYAGSNNSFGGYCTLENGTERSHVKICNDDMVGHFAIEKVTEPPLQQDLIEFTNAKCFGG
ncbi:lysozyme inhibitor LprI family protein [Dyella subtropica]|uniref:lysozyme inhibitor LprI family protein n=1 Tax=Dyella subtropica TaxID=2992127 RepID=UPI002253A3A3|nr:lysozyme inhibitor LprI family protein [Dyella subtropica]